MRSVQSFGAGSAPPSILIQADQIRRRIAASDSVAALVAELAFGPTRRSDLVMLSSMTSTRVASYAEARG